MIEQTRLDVSLTPPEGALYDAWAVYWREAGTVAWIPRGTAPLGRVILDGLPSRGSFEFAFAPMRAGVEADEHLWTVIPYTIGTTDFTAPPNVQNLRAGQAGAAVYLAWDPVTVEQLSHYEIRMGATWGNGVLAARVPAPLCAVTVGAWYTGATTWWIRAVTHQGLESADATSVALTVQADPYELVQGTTDEAGGGFAATKSGLEVSSGALRITKLPAAASGWSSAASSYTHAAYLPHVGSGTYTTGWTDRGSVVDERVEVSLTAEHQTETLAASAWTMPLREPGLDPGEDSILDRLLVSGAPRTPLDVTVEIDTAQDGVPTSDGWRRWVPGATYRYRQYRLRITLASIGLLTPRITALSHRTRRRNLKDEVSVEVSATGGTDVTWTTPFTAAPKVTATVVAAAARYVAVSNVTLTGCKVRVYDNGGTEQSSGTVHVHALGV